MPENNNRTNLSYLSARTEIGRLHLVAHDTHLVALAFDANWPRVKARLERAAAVDGKRVRFVKDENKWIAKTLQQIEEFTRGRRKAFTIPIDLIGSDFEKSAWAELGKIPFGGLLTYGEQAARLNRPEAIRAVAAANGRNPVSILIPCHRVIGKSGHLTGYAGGIGVKQKMLEIEGLDF